MARAEPIREHEIRTQLLRDLTKWEIAGPQRLVVEELGLCQGETRVDVAAIGTGIHGYEIKSDLDTLGRLPRQRTYYDQCLTRVTAVATQHHIEKLRGLCADWWGIACSERTAHGVELTLLRAPQQNPEVSSSALVQLLWREEALELASELGADDGLARKPREAIWERVAATLRPEELLIEVTKRMRERASWRTQSGGLPPNVRVRVGRAPA